MPETIIHSTGVKPSILIAVLAVVVIVVAIYFISKQYSEENKNTKAAANANSEVIALKANSKVLTEEAIRAQVLALLAANKAEKAKDLAAANPGNIQLTAAANAATRDQIIAEANAKAAAGVASAVTKDTAAAQESAAHADAKVDTDKATAAINANKVAASTAANAAATAATLAGTANALAAKQAAEAAAKAARESAISAINTSISAINSLLTAGAISASNAQRDSESALALANKEFRDADLTSFANSALDASSVASVASLRINAIAKKLNDLSAFIKTDAVLALGSKPSDVVAEVENDLRVANLAATDAANAARAARDAYLRAQETYDALFQAQVILATKQASMAENAAMAASTAAMNALRYADEAEILVNALPVEGFSSPTEADAATRNNAISAREASVAARLAANKATAFAAESRAAALAGNVAAATSFAIQALAAASEANNHVTRAKSARDTAASASTAANVLRANIRATQRQNLIDQAMIQADRASNAYTSSLNSKQTAQNNSVLAASLAAMTDRDTASIQFAEATRLAAEKTAIDSDNIEIAAGISARAALEGDIATATAQANRAVNLLASAKQNELESSVQFQNTKNAVSMAKLRADAEIAAATAAAAAAAAAAKAEAERQARLQAEQDAAEAAAAAAIRLQQERNAAAAQNTALPREGASVFLKTSLNRPLYVRTDDTPAANITSSLARCSVTSNDPGCKWKFVQSPHNPSLWMIQSPDPSLYLSSRVSSFGEPQILQPCTTNTPTCQWSLRPSLTREGSFYIKASDADLYVQAQGADPTAPDLGSALALGNCEPELNYTSCQWVSQ